MNWILFQQVFSLLELGLQAEVLYKELKAKYKSGATDDEIKIWLDGLLESSVNDAQAAIDAKRKEVEGA